MKRLHQVQLQRDFFTAGVLEGEKEEEALLHAGSDGSERKYTSQRICHVEFISRHWRHRARTGKSPKPTTSRARRCDSPEKGLGEPLAFSRSPKTTCLRWSRPEFHRLGKRPWLWNAAARFLAVDGKRVLAQPMRSRIRKHATMSDCPTLSQPTGSRFRPAFRRRPSAS